MEVKMIEKKANSAKAYVKGENHTFINLLRNALWDAGAEGAAYKQEHPLKDGIVIMIQGKEPVELLKSACASIEKDASSIKKAASKLS